MDPEVLAAIARICRYSPSGLNDLGTIIMALLESCGSLKEVQSFLVQIDLSLDTIETFRAIANRTTR